MSYNLVDPVTGDLTRVAGNSNIVDTAIEIDSTWSSKKINDSLEDIENIPRLTDFDEAIPEKGKNKIYYVNKTIGTYNCAQWRVESMYYDVSGLNQYRGVQKATSLNGVDNIMLMREYYSDSNNVIRWTDWQELATMDKVVPQVIMENKTTDDARTIIQNSWDAFPTNNSLARIETSIFTWSAQIYKHDSYWGTIILTCYADNKDSYIGKLSNKVWHWYKMGLTEV